MGEISFRLFHVASKIVAFEVLLGECVIWENLDRKFKLNKMNVIERLMDEFQKIGL